MRKGTRVYVQWRDIVTDTHSSAELIPAELVGWIRSQDKFEIEFEFCRYKDTKEHPEREHIAIPKGCITKMVRI
jgi:hypothetical protein